MARPTKILLADLGHTYSVSDASLTMPLGIGYVKAYAVDALGASVDIRLFKHPERFLAAVASERPDIVGFANYGWNQNLTREIGRHTRHVLPEALIVAGGPNIDADPVRRLAFLRHHDYLDYAIVDGGEEPFTELVTWHRDTSRDPAKVPANVIWRDGDQLRATAERPLHKIIERLPSPYLNGHLDEFLDAGLVPLFETNRGCPFKCTFCAWGSASKDLVRRIDLDQALAEIAYVGKRSRARNWIVCDANFGILPRDVEIAKAIRSVRNEHGRPLTCNIWLAKNVTDRCLEIGEIFGDMAIPVMAVQSLDDQVLEHIKRNNISLDTYEQYQRKFHRIGARTYSDLIVPLPGETLKTHLAALRRLIELGVDIVATHNMRLLAGAESNSTETRERFGFRTRYRLIHGDAGLYRAPDGQAIRVFEYEESLRATDTMSEADLFFLRKLHFLADFAWNIDVYKPLLKLALLYGVNPVDVLTDLLAGAESGAYDGLQAFFAEFDLQSKEEWYDSADAIEAHFLEPERFQRLLNGEHEKLNIRFSVLALKDFKPAFDQAVLSVVRSTNAVPPVLLEAAAAMTFSLFPPLESPPPSGIELPENLLSLNEATLAGFVASPRRRRIPLSETRARRELRQTIAASKGASLSKILNTQGLSLYELAVVAGDDSRFDQAFRRAI